MNSIFQKILIFLIIAVILCPFAFVLAEEETENSEQIEVIENPAPEIQANAGEDRNVVVGRQIVFSALGSVAKNIENEIYKWEFGDGYYADGKEVTHVYRNSGVYRVNLTVIAYSQGEEIKSTDEIIVNVDKDVIILISDTKVTEEKLAEVDNIASPQGILVVNIQEESDEVDYVVEKELAQKIIKHQEDIIQAGSIVIWTEKNIGLNAFLEAAQILSRSSNGESSLKNFGFNNKFVVVSTDQNFTATAKLSQSLYNLIEPQFIVLTREQANPYVFSRVKVENLTEELRNQEIDYRLVGMHTKREASGIKVWNFLSYLVSYMVDRGVPLNTIYLMLVLPIIATIIAFAHQIIGLKSLGIYAPSIIAVSFLVTGLKYGLAIFFVTLIVGTLGRLIAKKIRLSYLPRMANVLIAVCLSIFMMFFFGAFFDKKGLMEISIFPILIMVLLTENFIAIQIERGSKKAIILITETLLLSIFCFWLANWQVLRTFIIAYPEYILLTIVINMALGKWTGLRLFEYYRFRKVIKNVELDEKK